MTYILAFALGWIVKSYFTAGTCDCDCDYCIDCEEDDCDCDHCH